jgi:hypothetical protein
MDHKEPIESTVYRDSATLKLAKEINDFVRSRTNDPAVASIALGVAQATCSFVEWPRPSVEYSSLSQQDGPELSPELPLSVRVAAVLSHCPPFKTPVV